MRKFLTELMKSAKYECTKNPNNIPSLPSRIRVPEKIDVRGKIKKRNKRNYNCLF